MLANESFQAYCKCKTMTMQELGPFVDSRLALSKLCYDEALALGQPGNSMASEADSYLVINTSSQELSRLPRLPSHPGLKVLAQCVDPITQAQRSLACHERVNSSLARVMMDGLCHHQLNPCLDPRRVKNDVYRSLYVDQIRNLLCAGIQPSQVMVLPTSSLQNPHRVVKQIASWVNHPNDYMTPRLRSLMDKVVHYASNSKGRTYPASTSQALNEYFEPYNKELLKLLDIVPFVRPDDLRMFEDELAPN
eukprot:m.26123 g.26123  ORF g.26123 m.26123 type:complete len:250 (-) comp11659_c0_seq2:81-830(-)